MSNMWDLPEQHHPIHGKKKRKHVEHHEREEHEERPEEHFEKVGKVITDAAITTVGIGVIGSLGVNLISSLRPK